MSEKRVKKIPYGLSAFELREKRLKGFSFTNLNLYRRFYLTFPQTIQALPEQFKKKMLQRNLKEKR